MSQGSNYNLIAPGLTGGTFTGPGVFPAGTAAAPGVGVGAATDGLFEASAGVVGLTGSGTEVARFGATLAQVPAASLLTWNGRSTIQSPSDGVVRVSNNAAGNAGQLHLGNASGAGIWLVNTNALGAVTNTGTYTFLIANRFVAQGSSNAVYLGSTGQYVWTNSSAGGDNGTPDTGLARNAAGVMAVTTGSGTTPNGTVAALTAKLGGCTISAGAGSPNSSVTGSPGDLYLNTSGGAGTTFYVKESGSATNTGWVGK